MKKKMIKKNNSKHKKKINYKLAKFTNTMQIYFLY